ncbi:MAG: hypothetical protein RLZZ164_1075 [Actinomycetota bacterium]|jgi:CobQ-like glutamine amidotransferase family enzyme
MIRLLELFPEHLNLNGDRANLLVLRRRAEWGGIAVSHETLHPGQLLPIERPDVVLIGHGSAAAWRQAYPALRTVIADIENWMLQGTQVIAVSTGYAALHGLLGALPASVNKVDRLSNFVVDEFEGKVLCGYKNSDLDLDDLSIEGNLIGTLLHGPLLAKNPWLADRILGQIIAQRPELKENRSAMNAERFAQINALIQPAIEVATEMATS